MSFLAGLAANIIEWLLSNVVSVIMAWFKKREQDQAIKDQADKDQKESEDAKTPDDRAQSAVDTAHDTFS